MSGSSKAFRDRASGQALRFIEPGSKMFNGGFAYSLYDWLAREPQQQKEPEVIDSSQEDVPDLRKAAKDLKAAFVALEKAKDTVADVMPLRPQCMLPGSQEPVVIQASSQGVEIHSSKKGIYNLSEAEFRKWVAEETAAQEAKRRRKGESQSARPR